MKVKSSKWYKKLVVGLFSISAIALYGNISPVQSQIVPDETLDEEGSRVTPDVEINGVKSDRIDGGATRGANLFHSFSELNVGEGQGAYFTNPAGIENILSRVTGGNPSEILGRLGVTGGDANLFLINPNGIIFGENASLDVGGSFVGTTANGIGLGEDGSFNATEPQTSNLLSVNPSALFFNAVAAQAIVNRSQAASPSGETNVLGQPVGLQVPEGKSLALIGGDVFLEKGNLTATEGRIELGSVAGGGEVSLNQSGDNLLLGYEGVQTFGDIRLEGAFVDANEGSAKIETGNLIVSNAGQVFTGTFSERDGGDINVNATESIEVIGSSTDGQSFSRLTSQTEGSGDAGSLTINSGNLAIENGAQVSSGTKGDSSTGDGGDLTINVLDTVRVSGASFEGLLARLNSRTDGFGDAGSLTINSGNLIIENGAQVASGTNSSSTGDGGDLTIVATERVQVNGASSIKSFDDGGNLSRLTSRTEGSGDAGNLTITSGNLIIENGAQVSSGTNSSFSFSTGDGGDLTINVLDTVRVSGESFDDKNRSRLTSRTEGSGDAGNLTITSDNLVIKNGAQVANGGFSEGKGGLLTVNASESVLINDSDITTNALQSSGGVINITAGDIRLRGDGDIATNVSTGKGNAGDINLTADSIVAFDDSDIISSAKDGQGGDINLDTPAFFGDGYQDSSSNTNQNH
jgi:filamentous hemagglutinin family protein